MYGRIGVLATDGEKVQCHICGRWLKRLSVHVGPAHDMTPDEYRAEFGLKATQGLVSPEQREFFVQNARSNPEHLKKFAEMGRERWTGTHERYRRTSGHSPQERLEAERSGRYKEFHDRMVRGFEALGSQEVPAEETDLPVVAGGEDAKYFRQETQKTALGKRMSEGQGKIKLVEMSCVVCGARYLTPKARPIKTCSEECRLEVKRRQAAIMRERRPKR